MNLDNYEIITELGSGTFAHVYLVREKKTNLLYALKQIILDKKRTKDIVMKEPKILAKLKHPNIVSYQQFFFDENITGNTPEECLYMVQDYCDNGTLEDKIQNVSKDQKYFEEKLIMNWFVQLLLAIHYIHSQKVLHRDIKPANVFITKRDIVKLGDFGIAKQLDHTIDFTKTTVGTPSYLSPELCQETPYSTKSDIWALGCLLYETCSLRTAFLADNLLSLCMKIITLKYPPPPSYLSKEIIRVLEAILQRSPHDRPSANMLLNIPFIKENLKRFLKEMENSRSNSSLTRAAILQMNSQISQSSRAQSACVPSRQRATANSIEIEKNLTQSHVKGQTETVSPLNIDTSRRWKLPRHSEYSPIVHSNKNHSNSNTDTSSTFLGTLKESANINNDVRFANGHQHDTFTKTISVKSDNDDEMSLCRQAQYKTKHSSSISSTLVSERRYGNKHGCEKEIVNRSSGKQQHNMNVLNLRTAGITGDTGVKSIDDNKIDSSSLSIPSGGNKFNSSSHSPSPSYEDDFEDDEENQLESEPYYEDDFEEPDDESTEIVAAAHQQVPQVNHGIKNRNKNNVINSDEESLGLSKVKKMTIAKENIDDDDDADVQLDYSDDFETDLCPTTATTKWATIIREKCADALGEDKFCSVMRIQEKGLSDDDLNIQLRRVVGEEKTELLETCYLLCESLKKE